MLYQSYIKEARGRNIKFIQPVHHDAGEVMLYCYVYANVGDIITCHDTMLMMLCCHDAMLS